MVIDSLEVELQAQAKSVGNALDNVVETLDRIIDRINIIGKNSGMENFAKNVTQQMSSVKSVTDKITKSIEPQVQKTSKLLEGLGKDFNIKGKTDSNQFESLKMGSEEVETSIRNVAGNLHGMSSAAETALQRLINSFAKSNLAYAEQIKRVGELRSRLLELSDTKIETPEFKQATKDIQTAEKNLDKYMEKQGKLVEEAGLPPSIVYEVYAKEIKELSDALDAAKEKQRELIESGGAYTAPDISGTADK